MIDGYKTLQYSERLEKCALTTLETRRLRGDLIELFKIVKGFEGIDVADLNLQFSSIGRGHMFKLYKKRFRTDIGKFNFANRVVNSWNELPTYVVESTSVNMFKNRLDCCLRVN